MDDLMRYSCQLPLSGFGKKGQEKLSKAKVLIVGMGGLGCPVSIYLAAAGVGTIGICDFDKVTLKNLHRQILYDEKDVGKSKVGIAEKSLKRQNPSANIIGITDKIISKNVLKIIEGYDIVVDCTDNFGTRYLLNDACVISKKPLVYGSIFQFEGQVSVFNIKNKNGTYSPNYRDIFPEVNDVTVPNCEDGGVIPTIAGIIGSVQANEAMKYITGVGDLLASKLFIFDARNLTSTIIILPSVSKTEIKRIYNDATPLVTVLEFKNKLKMKCGLIDVRTAEEHREFNIGGKNIPLEELSSRVSELPINKPLVIYCRSGVRSAQAVRQILNAYPKANVASLDGGLLAWQDKVVTG